MENARWYSSFDKDKLTPVEEDLLAQEAEKHSETRAGPNPLFDQLQAMYLHLDIISEEARNIILAIKR